MKLEKFVLKISLLALIFVFAQCNDDALIDDVLVIDDTTVEMSSKGKPDTTGETFGNNLSFPVIWSDGVTKALQGVEGEYSITGEWWGVWNEDPIDPQAPLYSCGPYIGDDEPCIDAEYRAYVQKDENNVWQASNGFPDEFGKSTINVDFIDWGDNLESVDWYTKSQVRVEVVLLEGLATPVTQFAMRHVDSWGADEVHGLQTSLDGTTVMYGLGDQATVYSPNARFTIQKLNVDKNDGRLNSLEWIPEVGWNELGGSLDDLVNDAIFNEQAGAEVNVKGKIIYGTTWNVRSFNEGEGYYRLTFSFDPNTNLNTYFDATTEIIIPEEEEELSAKSEAEGGDSGGGTAVKREDHNLTYMDILIKARGTGQGGGNSGGGVGSGGGVDGNHGGGTGTVGSGNGSGSGSGHN
ncbi:hypothetical protein BX611_1336 [Lutibacter oceani]|uniref:Uncharacterized protein n=1 Tax=Lutibacter oceani TaxID=1853311 RepID=A0A3D9RPF5_9FLAO|nr:hypothetical protein [Lutibacter oceani]REE81799.1 hypothetical protein BX611_1336 [Lutibacter oceani]